MKNTFVIELKSAIQRVLHQPESLIKHQHLRALLDLISTSIEHAAAQRSRFTSVSSHNIHINKEFNTISILMVKHGIAQDLARLTHSLDLSSPYLAATLNGALKSLETLSKVAGYSLSQPREKKKDDKKDERSEIERQNDLIEGDSQVMDMEDEDEELTVESQPNTDCDQIDMDEDEEIDGDGEISIDPSPVSNHALQQIMLEGETVDGDDEINRSEDDDDDDPDDDVEDDDDDDDDDDEPTMERADDATFGNAFADPGLHPYQSTLQSNLQSLFENRIDFYANHQMNPSFLDNDGPMSHWGHDLDEADYEPTQMYIDPSDRNDIFMPFEDMFINSHFRRRTSTVNITSSSSTLRRAFGRELTSGRNAASNSDVANPSIMEPLNPVHPLLNRVNDERQNQSHSHQLMSRTGPLRERIHYDRTRPFGHSMLYPRNAHNIFRYPYNIFPSSTYPRHPADRLNPNRASAAQQDVGLVFEDLVPDNMWSCYDSGDSCRGISDYIFPSSFYRWAEETAVLDGESVHDLVLLFKARIIGHLIDGLKVDIAKRAALREERKKKEKEKTEEGKTKEKRKTGEGVEVQVNLIVEEANRTNEGQSDEGGVASNGAPTPAAVTPGNLTPGTPANTPNNTTRNTPTHTNSNTPATSGPNTRPDSPVGDQLPTNHDDHLQEVSEVLQLSQEDTQFDVQSQTSFEYFTAESEPDTAPDTENMDVAHQIPATDEQIDEMSIDGGTPSENTDQVAAESLVEPATRDQDDQIISESPPDTSEEQLPESTSTTTADPVINPWDEIDPTFLVALPEEYRRDIYSRICDDVRRQATQSSTPDAIAPINPEFLGALPDNIRSEVTTAHNRAREEIEIRRQRAQASTIANATSSGVPGIAGVTAETDPASFIANLDHDLRRQILSDLDDETINRLPSDLASEARSLQQEIHQRQIRFLSSRNPRTGGRRQTFQGRPNFMSTRLIRSRDPRRLGIKRSAIPHLPVKNSLDSESLTCLLVIIFINDSNIQQPKLHRILKNVSNHRGTRNWLTSTLIDIIKRTSEVNVNSLSESTLPEWLSLKLEASLGTRHCVFHLDQKSDSIAIHSQAAAYICRSTLDCLIYLAKCFPRHFVTAPDKKENAPFFWDLLLRLEQNYTTKPLKKTDSNDLMNTTEKEDPVPASTLVDLDCTILAQLLRMLKHPVINENRSLIDKMLNLLGFIKFNFIF